MQASLNRGSNGVEDIGARSQLGSPRKKVLHIIESFNGQAIEQWLCQVMRQLAKDEERFDWTFYATLGKPGRMDDAVRELGGKIIYSQQPLNNRIQFVKELRGALSDGKFDVLHSHHDILSAVYFLASAALPIKKRIVHVHNTSLGLPTPSPIKNILLREPMRRGCLHWADHIVGVSDAALDAFLRGGRRKPGRDMVIHCGIETTPYHQTPPNRTEFLQSLGLPSDARVLLFVGRMVEYKNPCFVIDILAHLSRWNLTACAVFAGAGPLEDEVRKRAEQKSLGDRVKVLGWRDDIPSFMNSSDILIWPGLEEPKEGLGLGVVEAQAAGLPVLMSRNVPEDAVVVTELVSILPLAAGAPAWASKIEFMLQQRYPAREASLAKIEASSFSIARSAANIAALHGV